MAQGNIRPERRTGALRADELRRSCEAGCLGFASTAELADPGQDVEGDRAGELLGRREHDGVAVVGQLGGLDGDLADLPAAYRRRFLG